MFTRLLEEPQFSSRIKCLIYDEAHFIVTSGQADKEGNIFRTEYSKGYEVRLRLPTNTPCAIFSATMSPEVMDKILTSLRIRKDPEETAFILLSTNRKNLCYAVQPTNGPLVKLSNLDFLFPTPVHPPMPLPKKTLIFVPSTDLALMIEAYLHKHLPRELVSRVHSTRSHRCKKRVIDDFSNPNGTIRVLVATTVISNVRLYP